MYLRMNVRMYARVRRERQLISYVIVSACVCVGVRARVNPHVISASSDAVRNNVIASE